MSHNYDRMQDITVTYATLYLKTIFALMAGSLIAIGAAYIDLLISDAIAYPAAAKAVMSSLSASFYHVLICLSVMLVALAIIYFSRTFYLYETDVRHDDDHRKLASTGAFWLEHAGVVLIIASTIFFLISLFGLVNSFDEISDQLT